MGWNQTDTYLLATLTGVLFGAISRAGLGTVLPNRAIQKTGQILFASGLPFVLGLWLVLRIIGVGN